MTVGKTALGWDIHLSSKSLEREREFEEDGERGVRLPFNMDSLDATSAVFFLVPSALYSYWEVSALTALGARCSVLAFMLYMAVRLGT